MKIKLVLLVFVLLSSFSSFSQDFVNSTNKWHISDVCYGQGGFSWTTYEYTFGEIVTIDSMEYRNLVTENTNPIFELGEFYREENGKVYLKPSLAEEEELIYNFNLSVGDTFLVDIPENQFSFEIVVETVDSILLNSGSKRKRISFNNLADYYWIEGIGGNISPLNTDGIIALDCWIDLKCYFVDNNLEFENGDCELGFGTTISANDLEEVIIDFLIFPNPVKYEFRIETDFEQLKSIQVFNSLGAELMQITSFESNLFDVDYLNEGVYYLVAKFKNGLYKVEKIVKF